MRLLTWFVVLICAPPLLAQSGDDPSTSDEVDAMVGDGDSAPVPLFGRRVQEDAASEEDSSDEEDEETSESTAAEATEQADGDDASDETEATEQADGDDGDDAPDETEAADGATEEPAATEESVSADTVGATDVVEDEDPTASPEESEEDAEQIDEVLDGIQQSHDAAEEALRQAADEAAAPIHIPPPNLSEPPSIPSRREPPPMPGLDEEAGWRPEVSVGSGLYAHEGVEVGFFIGAGFSLVEHGPRTRPEYLVMSDYARRNVWGVLDLELGVNPGEGLDETRVVVAIKAVRTETTTNDESESGVSEIRFGPVRYERSLSMDRELDVTVSIVEGSANRRYALRPSAGVRVIAAVGAVGFEHIRYTRLRGIDHTFNGVRAISLDLSVAPEFALGERGSQFRYIVALGTDVALGARDGGLLVVHSDMHTESGLGGDITDWLTWAGLIGYRGSVDSRRPNRAGWFSTIRVEGRLP